MDLWTDDYEPIDLDDDGDPDYEYRRVWYPIKIVKMTPKRIYTEPYRSAQGWGYQEHHPYFDRAALERDGTAEWSSRPAGMLDDQRAVLPVNLPPVEPQRLLRSQSGLAKHQHHRGCPLAV